MSNAANDVDPTYYMRVAAEAVRSANHAAYGAPCTADSVYDRAGAVKDLLSRTVQAIEDLARTAEILADHNAPAPQTRRAGERLLDAAHIVRCAATEVNGAWSHLSSQGEETR